MTSWGAGRSRRTKRGLLGLVLLASSVAMVASPPPASAAPGDDCGGGDTPPARHLASSQRCDGSLDEAPVSSTDHVNGYRVHRHEDAYSYSRTDGDAVRVESGHGVCVRTEPAPGTFVASGSGLATLAVIGDRTENTTPGISGPCPDQPGDYWVRVTVTPNDRPAVGHGPVPTSGQVGDTFTFTVSGTDPDGNLKSLGVRFPPSSNTDWKSQALPSGSWSTEFSYQFQGDTQVQFVARDVHGAESPPSPTFMIRVGHDDCGLGRDAGVEPVSLPFSCAGRLGFDGDVDSYTFALGAAERARARIAGPEGGLMTFTSPSGAVIRSSDSDDPELYSTAEAGTWRLDVTAGAEVTNYTLAVDRIGLPGVPVLQVSAAPESHQGDYFPIHMNATDPNGQSIQYEIDWGSNIRSLWPVYGRAQSGETVTGYRRFMGTTSSSFTAKVTATNQDGLSASTTVSVTIRPHHDCGLGSPGYDAPSTDSGAPVMPDQCEGTLGHLLPDWGGDFVDSVDSFRSPHQCQPHQTCRVRVTLTTSPGLAATVVIDELLTKPSASCGPGCTTQITSLAPYFGSGYPRISVRHDGGKGWYRLKVEKVPLTAVAG